MTDEPEILFDLRDGVAEVTLNRPKALNALTLDMVRVFDPQLRNWETDDAVRAVVVRGAGDRAFCAGGDIQKLYDGGPGSAITHPTNGTPTTTRTYGNPNGTHANT